MPGTLFNEGFLEVQFYPDSKLSGCTRGGGFNITFDPNNYSVCSPVWVVSKNGAREFAAFNTMLRQAGGHGPLVMHAGDTITVHYYQTPAHDGAHITVHDLTTKTNGTIILNNSRFGPMNPAFNQQKIGNTLGWGLVRDAPNAFVWEIGHESPYPPDFGAFCIPGDSSGACQSFNAPAWAGTTPIRILGVTFAGGKAAKHWGVVSDTGGKAEVLGKSFVGPTTCKGYGGPYCIYPYYTQNKDGSFSYGVRYPTTFQGFGGAGQFSPVLACGGPFGPNSTYCMTKIQ